MLERCGMLARFFFLGESLGWFWLDTVESVSLFTITIEPIWKGSANFYCYSIAKYLILLGLLFNLSEYLHGETLLARWRVQHG